MYKAHRDERFYYAHEVIEFIEEMQCKGCGFKENDPSMPMCFEISGAIICEEPVEALDDRGNDGVVCTKYRPLTLVEQEHPDQGRLL